MVLDRDRLGVSGRLGARGNDGRRKRHVRGGGGATAAEQHGNGGDGGNKHRDKQPQLALDQVSAKCGHDQPPAGDVVAGGGWS